MKGSITEMDMRWDLLELQPPIGSRFTVRLGMPSRCSDVYIAVDVARRRYVLVRIPSGEPSFLSERASRGIAVQTVEMNLVDSRESGVFVEISCLDESGYAALDVVTLELIDAIEAGASIGRVVLVQRVLAKWRRFWSVVTQNLLSREQQLGLFGEIWFLSRWLMPAVGAERAISMWRGPVGARNDFEQQGLAIEVKTSGKLDGAHRIHGLEQLLTPIGAELFLFSLLVRDEASGTESLSRLVQELREVLLSDPILVSRFEAMLAASGFEDLHVAEYDKLKLRIRGQGLYRVDDSFPRLIPSSIQPSLPVGVSNVDYELRLDAARHWLVSEAPAASYSVLKRAFLD